MFVHVDEYSPFWTNTDPTWEEISGDPKFISVKKPVTWKESDWLHGGSTAAIAEIKQPWGEMYRFRPARIHSEFVKQIGIYPYLDTSITSIDQIIHCQADEYTKVFEERQLRDWNVVSTISYQVNSRIPGRRAGLFAGANT